MILAMPWTNIAISEMGKRQLGSIRCEYNARWQHLSQMKDRFFRKPYFFFQLEMQQAINWDQCCHLQDGGAPFTFQIPPPPPPHTRKFYNIKQGSKHSHEPDRCADGSGDGDFFDDASTFVERHRRRRRVGRRLGDDLELGNPAERVESLAPEAERLQLVGRQVLEGRDLGGAVRGAQQPEIRIG